MRITVDFDLCASTGNCMHAAPDAFELREDGYLYVLLEAPSENLRPEVERAARMCPTGAITVTED
jgi:ferredoxin